MDVLAIETQYQLTQIFDLEFYMENKSLSSRYYISESTTWALCLFLIISKITGITTINEIPILNFDISNSLYSLPIVFILLFFSMLYQSIEWSNSEHCWAKINQLRFYICIITSMFCYFFTFSHAFQFWQISRINPTWFLIYILLGTIIGFFATEILSLIRYIRPNDKTFDPILPKVPVYVKRILSVFIFCFFITIIIGLVFYLYTPTIIKPFLWIFSTIPILLIFVNYFLSQKSENEVQKMQSVFDFMDYYIHMQEGGFQESVDELGIDMSIDDPEKLFQNARKKIDEYCNSENDLSDIEIKGPLKMQTDEDIVKMGAGVGEITHTIDVPKKLIENIGNIIFSEYPETDPQEIIHAAMYCASSYTWSKKYDIFSLAMAGKIDEIENVVDDKSIDINMQNPLGWTGLHAASAQGHYNIVSLLLQKGANPNLKNLKGYTSISFSAEYGFNEISNLLIEYGADVNIADMTGKTPLMHATINGHISTAELLLNNGADRSLQDMKQQSALDFAFEHKQGEIAKMIQLKH